MYFDYILIVLIHIFAPSRAWRYSHPIIETRALEDSEPPNLEPEIPDHCQDRNICEDVPNYPYKYIDQLLENNLTMRNALFLLTHGFEGAAGCKKDEDYVTICRSRMEYVQAKAARGSNGRWYFVVGRTGICEELCTLEQLDKNCTGPISIYTDYTASCKQNHVKVPIAVLNENYITVLNTIVYAGCWCRITKNDSSVW